ncbi:hypothetical protein L6R50_15485 [Myxococcota bacterium]|nr:hypothetical protein [Myxococcota bacterium]
MSAVPLEGRIRERLLTSPALVVHAPDAPLGEFAAALDRPTLVCLDGVGAASVAAALGAAPIAPGTPGRERAKALSRDPAVAAPVVVITLDALADPLVGAELLADGPLELLVPGADALRPGAAGHHPGTSRLLRWLAAGERWRRLLLLADDPRQESQGDLLAALGLDATAILRAPPARGRPPVSAVPDLGAACARVGEGRLAATFLLPPSGRSSLGALGEALGERGVEHLAFDAGGALDLASLASALRPRPSAVLLLGAGTAGALGGSRAVVLGDVPCGVAGLASLLRASAIVLPPAEGRADAPLDEASARGLVLETLASALPAEAFSGAGDPPPGAVAWRQPDAMELELWSDLAAAGLVLEVVPTTFHADLADVGRFRRPFVDEVPALAALHRTYQERLGALSMLEAASHRLTGGKSRDLRELAAFLGLRVATLVSLLLRADDHRVLVCSLRSGAREGATDAEIVFAPGAEARVAADWGPLWGEVERLRASRERDVLAAARIRGAADVRAALAALGDAAPGRAEDSPVPVPPDPKGRDAGPRSPEPHRRAARHAPTVEQAHALERLFSGLPATASPSAPPPRPAAPPPRESPGHASRLASPVRPGSLPVPREARDARRGLPRRGAAPATVPDLPGLAELAAGDALAARAVLSATPWGDDFRAAALVMAFRPAHGPAGGPPSPRWELTPRQGRAAEVVWDALHASPAHLAARIGAVCPEAFVERTGGGRHEVFFDSGEDAGVLELDPVDDIEALEACLLPAAPPSWLPARRADRFIREALRADGGTGPDLGAAFPVASDAAVDDGSRLAIAVIASLAEGNADGASEALERLREAAPASPALTPLSLRIGVATGRWSDLYSLPDLPSGVRTRAVSELEATCRGQEGCGTCPLLGSAWCPVDDDGLQALLRSTLRRDPPGALARRLVTRASRAGLAPDADLVAALGRLPVPEDLRGDLAVLRPRARGGRWEDWGPWIQEAAGDLDSSLALIAKATEQAGAPSAVGTRRVVDAIWPLLDEAGHATVRRVLPETHPVVAGVEARRAEGIARERLREGRIAALMGADPAAAVAALEALRDEDPQALDRPEVRCEAERIAALEARFLAPVRADVESRGGAEPAARAALAAASAEGGLEWLISRLAAESERARGRDPGISLWWGRALLVAGRVGSAEKAFSLALAAVRSPGARVEWTLEWFGAAVRSGERRRAASFLETQVRNGLDVRPADAFLDVLFQDGVLGGADAADLKKVLERLGGARAFPRAWARIGVLDSAEPWKLALAKLKLG